MFASVNRQQLIRAYVKKNQIYLWGRSGKWRGLPNPRDVLIMFHGHIDVNPIQMKKTRDQW